jgi:raffinose/stachyose/melibiose transport system permease protein
VGAPRQNLSGRRHAPRWRNIVWTLPALLILGAFVYWPLVQNLFFSVTKWNIYSNEQEFVGTGNYSKMMADPVFWSSLINNVFYAVVSVIVQVSGALALAAVIEGLRSERLRRLLRAAYFIPSAISLTVAGLLFYFIYEPRLGLLNGVLDSLGLNQLTQAWLGQENTAIWGIITMSQWQGFGYSTLLFAVAIQRIPSELYDAAAIDGVGGLTRFWTITMPLTREMTGLMMIVTVAGSFQVFNEVMVMTSGGPNNSSQVLGTWLYRSGFVRNDFGYAAAIATVIFVVTIVLALLQLWHGRKRRVEW